MAASVKEAWRSDGIFWIGDDEDNTLHGTLIVYENGRSELLLAGLFPDEDDNFLAAKTRRLPVINGRTEKYHSVSMLHATEMNRNVALTSGFSRCLYTAKRTFASYAAHEWREMEVLDLQAKLEAFETWLGISGFNIDRDFEEHTTKVNYKLPEKLTFEINEIFSVQFGFSIEGPSQSYFQAEVVMKQNSHFTIKSKGPRALEEHLKLAQNVADLICLGIGEAMAYSPDEARFAVPTTVTNGMWANLFFVMTPCPDVEVPYAFNMLFSYRDVEHKFGAMIKTWISNLPSISSTYQLYFATIRSSGMYVEHRLFNFFQALESFHRRKYGDDVIDGSASTPSAGKRIKDIVQRFQCEWVFQSPWEESLASITKVRNYLVHNERKPSDDDLTSLAILNAGSRLQMLCEIVLLSQAGLSSDEASKLLHTKARERRLIYQ